MKKRTRRTAKKVMARLTFKPRGRWECLPIGMSNGPYTVELIIASRLPTRESR